MLALGVASAPASAQVPRSGGGDSRAVQQLQQLAQERTALQAENARLKTELEKAKADAASATTAAAAARSRLAAAEALAARAAEGDRSGEAELAETRTRLTELVGRYRELAENLRAVETERNTAREVATQRARAFDGCAQANAELYGIAAEVLARWENAGFGTALGRAEPFTRMTRTRIENLADEYRARAEELKVAPGGAASR